MGVGKSSFLNMLAERMSKRGHAVCYVTLTSNSAGTIFREFLAELLVMCQQKQLKRSNPHKVNLRKEAKRLYAGLTEGIQAGIEAKLLGSGFSLQGTKSKSTIPHTEGTAIGTIGKLLDGLEQQLDVILDDFEKLKYQDSERIKDYVSELTGFLKTLHDKLHRPEVTYIVTLDNWFKKAREASRKDGGEFGSGIEKPYRLDNLKREDAVEFIKVRIETSGWAHSISDFMTLEAFWALSIVSENHPRRLVLLLGEAMEAVFLNKDECKIQLTHIQDAAEEMELKFDKRQWALLEYFEKGGRTSPSNEQLMRHLGVQSWDTVKRTIDALDQAIGLRKEEEQEGRKRTTYYSVIPLDNWA